MNLILGNCLLWILLTTVPAFAQTWTFTPQEKAIIGFQRVAAEMDAVEIDVSGWMGWGDLTKKDWSKPLAEASDQLEGIKHKVNNIFVPEEFQGLKNQTIELITKLQMMYKILPTKTDKEIKDEFAEHYSRVDAFNKSMNDLLNKYYKMPDLSKGFSLDDEEVKLMSDAKDQADYQRSIELLKNKKYSQSKDIIEQLLKKYRKTNVEAGLITRLVDCYYMQDTNLNSADKEEKILKNMVEVMNRKQYSPFLYDLFYRWRTIDQSFEHGMSNMSEIPNNDYITKQWEVIAVIMKQVEQHPEDGWAKQQVMILASLGDIRRGGAFGNSNLDAMGALFLPAKEETKVKH